jgi:hypothetical protein
LEIRRSHRVPNWEYGGWGMTVVYTYLIRAARTITTHHQPAHIYTHPIKLQFSQ